MNEDRAARYHRLRRQAVTGATVARFAVLLMVSVGWWMARPAFASATEVALAALQLALATELASLLFVWRAQWQLERRFGLSRDSVGQWLLDHARVVGLELAGWMGAAVVAWFLLAYRTPGWWVSATAVFLLVGVLRAGLVGFVFRARPLARADLRARLAALARTTGHPVVSIGQWRVGSRTDTANAAVVGLGPTRRILVSDTLLEDYSDEEIEVVVAHELGHHAHHDVWQTIGFEAVTVGLALWIADGVVIGTGDGGGASTIGPAGLAALALTLGVVRGMLSPLGKGLSRWHERRADAYALAVTGNRRAFVSGLRRLGAQHLAEDRPGRFVEWVFYSHPPLASRLERAQADAPPVA